MVGRTLALSAERYPTRPAVVFCDVRLSCVALNSRACRVTNAPSTRGVAKGDRVATLLYKCPSRGIIVFVNELPQGENGKVSREQLRQCARQL